MPRVPPLWRAILALTLLCVLLQSIGCTDNLAYQRHDIARAELWRLLTGNLMHTNWWHLLMNLAGLWVVTYIHRMHYRASGFVLMMLLLGVMQGIGLYLFVPSLLGYVGLSGALHGLFVFGALCDIRKGWRSGWLLLIGVTAKVISEQTLGASNDVTALIGARVATEAHLIGLISGVLLFALFRGYRYWLNRA
ncbi:rhombosortase [Shewanella sp. A3A]|nr:rhombosortase [Shewanella ferrihydritica]